MMLMIDDDDGDVDDDDDVDNDDDDDDGGGGGGGSGCGGGGGGGGGSDNPTTTHTIPINIQCNDGYLESCWKFEAKYENIAHSTILYFFISDLGHCEWHFSSITLYVRVAFKSQYQGPDSI